jgi:hypothetical protein
VPADSVESLIRQKRSDAHAVAEFDTAFDDAIDVDFHIAAAFELAAQIETRRIGQAHALLAQRARLALLEMAFELGELPGIVRAEGFALVAAIQDRGRHAFVRRLREHVGEVELALRVAVVEVVRPHAQAARVGGKDAGVDGGDRALIGRGVFFLDHGARAADAVADHAPVAARIEQFGGKQGERRVGTAQRLERGGADQRHVAVQHQHARGFRHMRQRELHGVAGAALFRLMHPVQVGLVSECRAHGVAAMAVDDVDPRRIQFPRSWRSTCASIGLPASGSSTFGKAECMRLPSPAARTTTCRGWAFMRA